MTSPISTDERFRLAHLPTPLEPLSRLSAEIGRDGLWIKRDDCTGLAGGGNKTRKLEYLIADARRAGARAVITFGAVQSNHARQTAAACAYAGLECHLVLVKLVRSPHADYERGANVLLDRLTGAHVHLVEPGAMQDRARALREQLEAEGRPVYSIPPGGSNRIGARGYAEAAAELLEQCAEIGFAPDLVVHASSSGGTQAGLMAGFAAAGAPTKVLGINVGHKDHAQMEQHIADLAAEAATDLGLDAAALARPLVAHDYIGDEYGQPTREAIEAIRLLASREGILLDPVYSGKGMAGLLDLAGRGRLTDYRNIVFVHTGGWPVLPVYEHCF